MVLKLYFCTSKRASYGLSRKESLCWADQGSCAEHPVPG